MTPEEALKQFEQVTGLRVVAVHDPHSDALWWTLLDRAKRMDALRKAVANAPPLTRNEFEAFVAALGTGGLW